MGTPDKGVTTRPTDLLPGKRTHNTPRYPTAAACLKPIQGRSLWTAPTHSI